MECRCKKLQLHHMGKMYVQILASFPALPGFFRRRKKLGSLGTRLCKYKTKLNYMYTTLTKKCMCKYKQSVQC